MRLLQCAFQYVVREKLRNFLVLLGLTVAFGAGAFMYGAAGQTAHESGRCLRWVTAGADLWLVPPTGLRLDSGTGLIVCDSRLPLDILERAQIADRNAVIRAWEVAELKQSSVGPIVMYTILDRTEAPRIICSQDLWAHSASGSLRVTFGNTNLEITAVEPTLPDRTVARYVTESTGAPSWLMIATKNPSIWTHPQADNWYIVQDTPKVDETIVGARPILYPLTSSAARFNAFSFDARFDAVIVNGELRSALGRFARFVLAFGALVALTSSVFGLREKGALIAVLTAHGITGEMVGILLAEAAILTALAWSAGVTLAIFALKVAAFPTAEFSAILEGIAITTVFIPIWILGSTLAAAARLLSIPPAKLVKGAFA